MEQLSISIKCNSNFCHDWMAFASWYSINKKIPNCSIYLQLNLDKPIFRWANRVGVKISKKAIGNFVIDPTVMAVRDFDGCFDIVSSKSDIQKVFVDYKDGCGNFNLSKWIHTNDVPFYKAIMKFGTYNLTVNEIAILNIWEKCHHIYQVTGVA
jgi:hypothetical protein